MKVLELFAGTRSIGKAFEAKGHEVFSVEWDKGFENIDLYADINTITAEDILQKFGIPDVIWASPDCSTFSIAAISHHRRRNEETGNLEPVSEYAKFCDEVDQHVLQLIDELKPQFYFIENPRGGMRKMTWMQGLPRYTVTYCQYGDKRMKPNDIWTNHPDPQFKPMCKNGDPCHEKAPRGSKTGTQGLKGSKERSVIPEALCQHIVDICEIYNKKRSEKSMELKMIEFQQPKEILFNYNELKVELEAKVKMYETLVYTDDQIAEAKKDRSNLNKLKKALNDERIRLQKEYLEPFNKFKAQIDDLIQVIDKPILLIDKQVKEAEEVKKHEKKEAIQKFWNEVLQADKVPEAVTFSQIFNEKWLNATVSMKSIQTEIMETLAKIEQDLVTLENLPEFSFEAKEVYKDTLNLQKAIQEGARLAEIQKRKQEQEAEQARLKAEAAQHVIQPAQQPEEPKAAPEPQPLPTAPMKQWVSFKAFLTVSDAAALKEFFESRNIEFQQI